MTNGYLRGALTNAREWVAWRTHRIYWYVHGKYRKAAARIRKVLCLFAAHGKPVVSMIRYRQLRLDIGECRHCGVYIEIHARITTEVPYDQEIPFEGFKIEFFPNSDPTSAFYKPIDPDRAPVIEMASKGALRKGRGGFNP